MANRLDTNPIIIDTTNAGVTGPLAITAMAWVSTQETARDIAADDDLTITAGARAGETPITGGATLFAKRAESSVDNLVISFNKSWKVPNGFFVEDIDGGELHIWLE